MFQRRVSDNPEELDLELFGRWQTEEYIPPPAVNVRTSSAFYDQLKKERVNINITKLVIFVGGGGKGGGKHVWWIEEFMLEQ